MMERQDPTGKAMAKRNHVTDCLKYLAMANPQYIGPVQKMRSTWKPIAAGVNY